MAEGFPPLPSDTSLSHTLNDVPLEMNTHDSEMNTNDSEMHEFVTVNKKHCAKRNSSTLEDHPFKKRQTRNRFDLLDNITIDDVTANDSSPAVIGDTETNNENENVVNNTRSTKDTNKFCPPIFLEGTDFKNLIQAMGKKIDSSDFKIKNISATRCKIFLKSLSLHEYFMETFKKKGFLAYTHTPQQLRKNKVILRGLIHNTDVNELQSELELQLPNVIEEVKPYTTKFSRANNTSTGLFLVSLNYGFSISDVAKLKRIMYQMISWEKPHNNTKIVQCKNCQKWGHLAINCTRPFKCVKCDKTHNPGDCQLTKDNNSVAYCVNCHSWGHPANFTGCKAFQSFKNFMDNKKNSTTPTKPIITKINATNGISYAKVVANNSVNIEKPTTLRSLRTPKLIQDFIKIAEQILNPDPPTIEEKIANFLENYQNYTIDERRNQCLNLLKEVKNIYEY